MRAAAHRVAGLALALGSLLDRTSAQGDTARRRLPGAGPPDLSQGQNVDTGPDWATTIVNVDADNLLFTSVAHYYHFLGIHNETMVLSDRGCFAVNNNNFTFTGPFAGNVSASRYLFSPVKIMKSGVVAGPTLGGAGRRLEEMEEGRRRFLMRQLEEGESNLPYVTGFFNGSANVTMHQYDYCCLHNNASLVSDEANEALAIVGVDGDTMAGGSNYTVLSCYVNSTFTLKKTEFHWEKEEEDLVKSHWENFQHPKPTELYHELAKQMREEIQDNFIRTQTVKYEHDVIKESLHNETVRIKTRLQEKKSQNKRKMDLLFARHRARVTGLQRGSRRVVDSLEQKRRETSDHLANLKEDHLATVGALNQNARDVDEHLRVKTEKHMDAMYNYYERWHDNHEDAEETILNLRRSNGRVGENIEDQVSYFGNPEPLNNITVANITNQTTAATQGRRRMLAHENEGDAAPLHHSSAFRTSAADADYDVVPLDEGEEDEDEDDMWVADEGGKRPLPARGSRQPAEQAAAQQAADQEVSACVGWRQTAACSPAGARQPDDDLRCDAVIGGGRSGFCECTDGSTYPVSCGHAALTCDAACASGLTIPGAVPHPRSSAVPQVQHAAQQQAAPAAAQQAAAPEPDATVQEPKAAMQQPTEEPDATVEQPAAAAAAAEEPAFEVEKFADDMRPGWRPQLGRNKRKRRSRVREPAEEYDTAAQEAAAQAQKAEQEAAAKNKEAAEAEAVAAKKETEAEAAVAAAETEAAEAEAAVAKKEAESADAQRAKEEEAAAEAADAQRAKEEEEALKADAKRVQEEQEALKVDAQRVEEAQEALKADAQRVEEEEAAAAKKAESAEEPAGSEEHPKHSSAIPQDSADRAAPAQQGEEENTAAAQESETSAAKAAAAGGEEGVAEEVGSTKSEQQEQHATAAPVEEDSARDASEKASVVEEVEQGTQEAEQGSAPTEEVEVEAEARGAEAAVGEDDEVAEQEPSKQLEAGEAAPSEKAARVSPVERLMDALWAQRAEGGQRRE